MPILITGSSGHVGQNLAGNLLRGDRIVRGVDLIDGPLSDHVGDLLDLDLDRLLHGCEAVVHCAALHAPHVQTASAAAFVAANVTATQRLLAAARRSGVSRFVFLSTTSVYGHALEDPGQAVWVDEQLTPAPRDVYDRTKLDAETQVAAEHDVRFQTITLRIARCFPEPERTMAINRLYRGVDLRDVIHAIELALTADLANHHVLNVAGPRVFERSDCRRLRSDPVPVIRERMPGFTDRFERLGWELPETIDRVYVSDLASAVLGYSPTHDVASVLAEVVGRIE